MNGTHTNKQGIVLGERRVHERSIIRITRLRGRMNRLIIRASTSSTSRSVRCAENAIAPLDASGVTTSSLRDRLLVVDEAERLSFKALETIRDLHDQTGCPVLFCGKPTIYERLGFRVLGDYSEVTDQLASRIVMKRDLTEWTRGHNPEPLFSLADIRKLITQ